jgi:hypothetical protein
MLIDYAQSTAQGRARWDQLNLKRKDSKVLLLVLTLCRGSGLPLILGAWCGCSSPRAFSTSSASPPHPSLGTGTVAGFFYFFSGIVRLLVPVLQLSIQMDSSYPRTLLVCQSTVLLLALRTTGV